jgi:SpoVK/Ycf46/Vps4 family AAA+-type ATPase
VIGKVEEYIKSQVGEDVIEFARPKHRLIDLVGFGQLKKFLANELIPRLSATDDSALVGAAVCGPIGGGKTYIFEAVAAELGVPILVLKNMRSKWFGEIRAKRGQ